MQINQTGGTGQMVTVQEKLWLNAEKDQLVPDGHPDAAFLFATPDDQIAVEQAERFGLVDGRLKAGEPAANKQADPPVNKGGAPGGVVVDDLTSFDPSAHTAPEVVAYLGRAEKHEALRVLDAEAEGKKRSTVLAERDAVEQRVQGDGGNQQ